MLKPAPDTIKEETVTGTVPEFVRVKFFCWLEPAGTSPKFMLEGLMTRLEAGRVFEFVGLILALDTPPQPDWVRVATNNARTISEAEMLFRKRADIGLRLPA